MKTKHWAKLAIIPILLTALTGCNLAPGNANASKSAVAMEDNTSTSAASTESSAEATESAAEATESAAEASTEAAPEMDGRGQTATLGGDELVEVIADLTVSAASLDAVGDAFGQSLWALDYGSLPVGPVLDDQGQPVRGSDGKIKYHRVAERRIRAAKEAGLTNHIISDALYFPYTTMPGKDGWTAELLKTAREDELYRVIHSNIVVAYAYAKFFEVLWFTEDFSVADANPFVHEFVELCERSYQTKITLTAENGTTQTVTGNELWTFLSEDGTVYLTNGEQDWRDEQLAPWGNYNYYADGLCLLIDLFELRSVGKWYAPAKYHMPHNGASTGSMASAIFADYAENEECFKYFYVGKNGEDLFAFGSNRLDMRPVKHKDIVTPAPQKPAPQPTPQKPQQPTPDPQQPDNPPPDPEQPDNPPPDPEQPDNPPPDPDPDPDPQKDENKGPEHNPEANPPDNPTGKVTEDKGPGDYQPQKPQVPQNPAPTATEDDEGNVTPSKPSPDAPKPTPPPTPAPQQPDTKKQDSNPTPSTPQYVPRSENDNPTEEQKGGGGETPPPEVDNVTNGDNDNLSEDQLPDEFQ